MDATQLRQRFDAAMHHLSAIATERMGETGESFADTLQEWSTTVDLGKFTISVTCKYKRNEDTHHEDVES